MTIAEEIKQKLFTETKESVKAFIKDIIIKTMEAYCDRVVGFTISDYNMAKPIAVNSSSSPFPQVIIKIYIPEVIDTIEINKWMKEEGFEWDAIGGEYAWRLR